MPIREGRKGKREDGKGTTWSRRGNESRKRERTKARKGEQTVTGKGVSSPVFFGLSFFRVFVIARFACYGVSFSHFPLFPLFLVFHALHSPEASRILQCPSDGLS